VSVRALMSTDVATCRPFDSLGDAAERMLRAGVGCLPVVAADGSQRVVGMLSDRDVSLAAARELRELSELSVRSAMTPGAVTCEPSESLSQALERMREKGVRRLPVVDHGQLVGLLSRADIARAVAEKRADLELPDALEICRALATRRSPPREGAA
jgi:CBS domain-containing protein